ncbi:LysE family transporter [Archaeoglobus sp.]
MFPFLIKVTLISSSGALAPGPLTTATLAVGAKRGWKGGFKVALGHLTVEFPLVIVIALGLYILFKNPTFIKISSLVGGIFMIYFGYLTVKDAFADIQRSSKFEGYPFLVGVTLTALNPFFILWWIGIGSPLILEAITKWGFISLIPFYVAHVWLDFVWLTALAHATSFSGKAEKIYRIVVFSLGLLLVAFGLDFLSYGLFGFRFLRF